MSQPLLLSSTTYNPNFTSKTTDFEKYHVRSSIICAAAVVVDRGGSAQKCAAYQTNSDWLGNQTLARLESVAHSRAAMSLSSWTVWAWRRAAVVAVVAACSIEIVYIIPSSIAPTLLEPGEGVAAAVVVVFFFRLLLVLLLLL